MSAELDPPTRAKGADLIREAFYRARRKGKAEWHQMTTAVLNNRLRQISDNAFSIADFGATTVVDFAKQFPEVVRVEENPLKGPAIVTLIDIPDDAPGGVETGDRGPVTTSDSPRSLNRRPGPRTQVREDLWQAAMDWTHGHVYVLDPVTGRARQRVATDPAGLPALDGVSQETYVQWRLDYIDNALAADVSAEDRAALVAWRDSAGPSRDLPVHLQDEWMTLLRAKVADQVRAWFEQAGIPTPDDLVEKQGGAKSRPTLSASLEVTVATQRLREMIRRCVDEMSFDELQALQLPAGVVARVFGR